MCEFLFDQQKLVCLPWKTHGFATTPMDADATIKFSGEHGDGYPTDMVLTNKCWGCEPT